MSRIRSSVLALLVCLIASSSASAAVADLFITQLGVQQYASPGATVYYGVGGGTRDLYAAPVTFPLTVTLHLPAGVTYASHTGGTNCAWTTPAGSGGDVVCTTTAVTPGFNLSFTVAATVAPSAAEGASLGVTATFDFGSAGTTSASGATVVVAPTDMAVTVTPAKAAKAGAPYTLTAHVVNQGPVTARAANLTFERVSGDTLPFNDPGSQAWPCRYQMPYGSLIHCAVSLVPGAPNDFASGQSVDITVSPWSDPNATSDTVVVGTGMLNQDSNPANSLVTVVTPLSTSIVPTATITATPWPPRVNTEYTVTCVVTTDGPSAHDFSLVYDTPPHTVVRWVKGFSNTCTAPAAGAPGRVACTVPLLQGNVKTLPARWAVQIGVVTDTAGPVTHAFTANATNFANGPVSASVVAVPADQVIQLDAHFIAPGDPRPGDAQTFKLEVDNPSAYAVTSLTTDLTLPPGAVVKGGNGSCTGTHCVFTNLDPYYLNDMFFNVQFPAAAGKGTYSVTISGPAVIPQTLSVDVTTAVPDVQLSATLTPAAPRVAPGGRITFNLDVRNAGTARTSPLTITATVPQNLQVVDVGGIRAVCSPAPQVTCTFPSIDARGQESIHFSVQAATTPGTATVTANVTTVNATVPPQTAMVLITPPVSALTPSIFSDRTTVAANGQVRFSYAVINNGPDDAPDVAVEFAMHGERSVASVSSTAFSCTTQPPIRCTMPLLPNGRAANIDIIANAPSAAGTMSLDATITSPAAGAKTLSVSTQVLAPGAPTPPPLADLITRAGAVSSTVTSGQQFVTSFSVTNAGSSDASLVAFDVILSPGLTLRSMTTRGTCTAAQCTIGTLAPQTSVTITVTGTATRAGSEWIRGVASTSSQQSSRENDAEEMTLNVTLARSRAARH
jgi:hypothetical protein